MRFPGYPRALHLKGILLFKLDRSDDALAILGECLSRNPRYLDAMNSLGNICRAGYRYEDAITWYDKILLIDKSYYRALFCKGQIKQIEQDDDSALVCFSQVIKFNKCFVPALLGLISIYRKRNQLVDAEKLCRKVLKLEPENSEALYMLGAIRSEHGDMRNAIKLMEKIGLDSSYGLAANSSKMYFMNLLPEISQSQVYQEAREFEERFAAKLYPLQVPHVNCPDPERKLRIGFVSGDIKLHPVARHLRPLIQNLDREYFELYAYNNFNIHDDVTEEFKSMFCFWRNIHEISDEKAVEMVRLDTIDILFDLAGYTGFSRLMLFARKPAPLQVSWLGYFNTTGFSTMDYLISDDVTIHEDEELWFTEKILRMPHSRFCYDPREQILPEIGPLPAARNGYVTFGAFNKVNKLNDSVISTWSLILHAVPDSRLILKWFAYNDATAVSSISRQFVKYGIDPARLEFRPESVYVELLNEYTTDVDIVLDTFPHSGGATSCDALLMGVPVVTFSGALPISRQTHGFLKLMGLADELVGFSAAEYVEKAVALAKNRTRLATLRSEVRDRFLASPLCDGPSFTQEFEAQLRSIWRSWCHDWNVSKLLARNLLISNEVYNEGINLMQSHSYLEAAQYFRKVIEMEPKNDKAMNNLAICLWENGKLEESEQVLRRAHRVNKLNDDVCCNLSGILVTKDKLASLTYALKGLALNENNLDLHVNQAFALMGLSRLGEALAVLEKIGAKYPPSSKIMAMLGNCHGAMGNVDQAELFLRKSLELDASNADAHSNLLFTMNNSDRRTQAEMYEEALRWDSLHSQQPLDLRQSSSSIKNKKMRVGLVSGDLRLHPGGMLLRPFMEHYNRDELEVYCYYNDKKYDQLTNVLQSCADEWCEVAAMTDLELYRLIREQSIDILIDMNGHTEKHRLGLFTMKPCAIQATWIGYFNTTGIKAIDYFISDEFTTPDWMQKSFSEKIVRLPDSRFCYSSPEYSPLVSLAPSEYKGYITFGAFNNVSKLSETTLKIWSDVLKQVPKSRLLLKWKSYRDLEVKNTLIERFGHYGISASRLMIRKDIHHAQMLADYSDVDIVLDTFPFNGGMTSIEALWMGVPIVTLSGTTPASRQTGSFLRLLGLDGLIACNQDQYVAVAVKLASERERLYDIRGTLRQKMQKSPLMNGELFAKNMQSLFEQMLQEQRLSW